MFNIISIYYTTIIIIQVTWSNTNWGLKSTCPFGSTSIPKSAYHVSIAPRSTHRIGIRRVSDVHLTSIGIQYNIVLLLLCMCWHFSR